MTPEPQIIGHPMKFKKGLGGLIRKGFWYIPEVLGASVMGLVGIGLAIAGCMHYTAIDGDNREYRSTYTIVRPGDPRECRMRNPVFTSYKC